VDAPTVRPCLASVGVRAGLRGRRRDGERGLGGGGEGEEEQRGEKCFHGPTLSRRAAPCRSSRPVTRRADVGTTRPCALRPPNAASDRTFEVSEPNGRSNRDSQPPAGVRAEHGVGHLDVRAALLRRLLGQRAVRAARTRTGCPRTRASPRPQQVRWRVGARRHEVRCFGHVFRNQDNSPPSAPWRVGARPPQRWAGLVAVSATPPAHLVSARRGHPGHRDRDPPRRGRPPPPVRALPARVRVAQTRARSSRGARRPGGDGSQDAAALPTAPSAALSASGRHASAGRGGGARRCDMY
jgi:hypothetical protein